MRQLTQERILSTAKAAIYEPGYETRSGWCARWVKQVIRHAAQDSDFPPDLTDAKKQFAWFKEQGFSVSPARGSLPGDILYYLSDAHGPHGHVGIRVIGNMIAENSSAHDGTGRNDARGYRRLADVGKPDGIVRLFRVPK